ncbi:pyridoxamine 5'-phosphate oxidase family protein [Nocardioides sp. CER19]|uniref:pyridoxamine 5'-phosphate oxidase family protein n=1 Tax=Nocardioides sp. CER19 TaxID=3038538 RepID=UPI002449FCB1|nr:pyridoxamine 5'-phosphate oxidase family protein [Nocardioides sp. CER19]MDH2416898.1 pyridoxamine 5'-phosphate oxidase family protein [Nocardioides sp. CER19]
MDDDSPVRELTLDECWDFLATQELGRLAFRLTDDVHLVPVNYAVDGRTLLFRTAPGTKLVGVELGGSVAFEVDEVDGETARSVVIRGRARRLEEPDEYRADNIALHVWVDTPKYFVVELAPDEITGREFSLHRPWRRIRPAD